MEKYKARNNYIKYNNMEGHEDNSKENKKLRRRKIILINNNNNDKKVDPIQELITFCASLRNQITY